MTKHDWQISQYPTYEAYKDSGVEWLGQVPKEWHLNPGMVAFKENRRNNKGLKETTILSLSYGKIVIKPEEKLFGLVPESFETYQVIKPGDIIIRCTDLQNDKTSLRTGLSNYRGAITNAYLSLRVSNTFNPGFLHYYLRFIDTSKIIYKLGAGLRQNLSFSDFKRLPVLTPANSQQTLIADFLDQKTAQIDKAIAIKQRQIELLKERKQILIQQAVTQGLDPDVPMKDSGIDWIGRVPEHWQLSKVKHHIDSLPGYAFESARYSSNLGDIKLLRGINISPGAIQWDEVVYWPRNEAEKYSGFSLKEGDLVIAMDRPWISCGIRVAIVSEKDLPCLLLQRVGRIRGTYNLYTKYLNILLTSKLFLNYFSPVLTGISVPHISMEQIGDFYCPIPPLHEQKEIENYLNKSLKNLEIYKNKLNEQIIMLKEYKTTLINNAVTGKIKITPDMIGPKRQRRALRRPRPG